jgi:hypothetical protein
MQSGVHLTNAAGDGTDSGQVKAGGISRLTSGFLVRVGVIDRVLHRRDFFSIFIGNLDAELILQRHHQFHGVE